MAMPPGSPNRVVTVEDLAYVLFGNPIDPSDIGIVGRQNARMEQLVRWVRALTLSFFAALMALVGNLIVALHLVH
jgi:hypothetical protein